MKQKFTVQQQDDGQYDIVKIKLMYEGIRVKEFRVTGNLYNANKDDHG